MGSLAITILDRGTGRAVDAELLDGLAPEDLILLEAEWTSERSRILRELLRTGIALEDRPQSLRWNWRTKAHHLRLVQASGFAVVAENQWQGAMLTKSATHFSRLGSDRGKPLIYIDFLEVAPWNWSLTTMGQEGLYGRVGRHLFSRAVFQSLLAGFRGRVGLHALPQSSRFYRDICGMISLGIDEENEDLEYFELPETQATFILGGSN